MVTKVAGYENTELTSILTCKIFLIFSFFLLRLNVSEIIL